MFLLSLYFILFASIFLLVFLQTSRSLFLRSLGLFMIMTGITGYYVINGFSARSPYILGFTLLFGVLGFLSDYYSATLRTWFFGVSNTSIMHSLYGTMIAIFFIPLIFNLNLAHAVLIGTLIGSLVGEIRTNSRGKPASRIMKSMLGTVVGLYGMATKILVGIQMIDIILLYQ